MFSASEKAESSHPRETFMSRLVCSTDEVTKYETGDTRDVKITLEVRIIFNEAINPYECLSCFLHRTIHVI